MLLKDLIDAVVTAAEASADNLIRSEGRDIQLEESLDLHLPFLLPEGGYSCDTIRGIPQGFREFLDPICRKGLCSLTSQPNSTGDWTVYFREMTSSANTTYLTAHREPEVVTITLNKPLNSGMGVSIVAAKGAGQGNLSIYIKSIVKGGPAEMNGRLTAGDQLLSVDGQSLVGIGQERAAAIMMQTGPIVTLQVAKFGASFHGLGALLSDPSSEQTTEDEIYAIPNCKTYELYSVVDPGASQPLHGNSRRKKEQMMQRNRQLYRSNPNMTSGYASGDGDENTDPGVNVQNIAAVSSINLCTNDTYPREYLTLPTPKSQDRKTSESGSGRPQQTLRVSLTPLDGHRSSKKTFMRQALSQENLCVDSGGPLLDKQQTLRERREQHAKQTTSHYSSFPLRSSVSTHDILSDGVSPTKQQQGSRTSSAGVWRTPFSQHPTPTPSIQPIRIDIPVTRVMNTHTNPPLTTFQSSSLLALKMSQSLKVNGRSPQSPAQGIYACPVPSMKKLPQPQRSSTHTDPAAKPQVSIPPTKHVSFQDPPAQPRKDPLELSDPWRREAQEKLEKQQRLQAVELLQQEVQELQSKAKRSAEENERLRKLSLECQFQRRLQEIQQRAEEEEEDEEDLDMMVTIQQLEERTQPRRSTDSQRNSAGIINTELKEAEKPAETRLSQRKEKINTDQQQSGRSQDVDKTATKENQEEKIRRASAPEKLTFKERQRLFSLASSG